MSIDTFVKDGYGSGSFLRVDSEGNVGVIAHPHPPTTETLNSYPYESYFLNSSSSSDMRVNGATNNVDFYVAATAKQDLYIKTVAITIADAGAAPNEFGNLSALTNGVSLTWVTKDLGSKVIASGLKTNFDFVRLAQGNPTVNVISNVIGTSEAFFMVIDFTKVFGFPYGLKLRKGTTDKLVFTIKDDCTRVDLFNAVAYGSQS